MSELSTGGPPEPPFEAMDTTVEEPAGTVRERVRQVLSSLDEPSKVKTIANMADCSAEGARTALREYAEMGVVVQTNENPETYERNPRYFQFLRGHRYAQANTTEELQEQLIEAYNQHREHAERFEAGSPDAVDVDERDSSEAFETVREWKAILANAADLREAYRQQTGTALPSFDDLPTDPWTAATTDGSNTTFHDRFDVDPIIVATKFGTETPALLTLFKQQREMMETIRSLSRSMGTSTDESSTKTVD